MTDQAWTEQIAAIEARHHELSLYIGGGTKYITIPPAFYAKIVADIRVLLDAVKAERERADAAEAQLADARAKAERYEYAEETETALRETRAKLAAMTEAHAYEERRATSLREERDKCTTAAKLWQAREAKLIQEADDARAKIGNLLQRIGARESERDQARQCVQTLDAYSVRLTQERDHWKERTKLASATVEGLEQERDRQLAEVLTRASLIAKERDKKMIELRASMRQDITTLRQQLAEAQTEIARLKPTDKQIEKAAYQIKDGFADDSKHYDKADVVEVIKELLTP